MNATKRYEIFKRFREANPHSITELEYSTPFELLIAVLLSAQSSDVGVNKATRRLHPVANTPQAILDLGLDELTTYISTIGLYNNKVKNVIATCEILVNQYGGEVPREREALEALPGVGRKTANVVLNTAFGSLHFMAEQAILAGLAVFARPLCPCALLPRCSFRSFCRCSPSPAWPCST